MAADETQVDEATVEEPEDEDEGDVEEPTRQKRRFLFFKRREKTEPVAAPAEASEPRKQADEPEGDEGDAPPSVPEKTTKPEPVEMPVEEKKPAPVDEEPEPVESPEPREEEKPVLPSPPVVRVPVLRTGMLLDITVLVAGEKEIEEASKRIETDGTVSLPLIGKFPAADKTLSEFQKTLCERYDEQFFVDPQVVVDFSREGDEYASPWGHVTVLGAGRRPAFGDARRSQGSDVGQAE